MTKPASARRRRASIDAKQAVDLATAQSYSENVFLFVPNLIGNLAYLLSVPSFTRRFRLFACHSGRSLALFYEPPSRLLYDTVRLLVPFGRCGWASCAGFGSNVEVWGCSRHGDRSVCAVNDVPKTLTEFEIQGAQHRACCAISLLLILPMPFCSSSLSRSTSAAITCICTGMLS